MKIYSKSLRKCTWRRRKALLLMDGKGDMSEQAIVSEAMNPVVRKSQEGAGTLKRSCLVSLTRT